jgi:hypothetical protein
MRSTIFSRKGNGRKSSKMPREAKMRRTEQRMMGLPRRLVKKRERAQRKEQAEKRLLRKLQPQLAVRPSETRPIERARRRQRQQKRS